MTVGNLTGAIGFCLLVATGIVSGVADNVIIERIMYATLGMYILWWVFWGQNLKGWVGDSYHEMQAEIEKLATLQENREYSDGRPISADELSKIFWRQQRLIDKSQFHPDNPSNRR